MNMHSERIITRTCVCLQAWSTFNISIIRHPSMHVFMCSFKIFKRWFHLHTLPTRVVLTNLQTQIHSNQSFEKFISPCLEVHLTAEFDQRLGANGRVTIFIVVCIFWQAIQNNEGQMQRPDGPRSISTCHTPRPASNSGSIEGTPW